jgi:hypothetical protein
MKLDLLTNATVVDDAIRFVYDRSKDKTKSRSSSSDEDEKESNEPGYDEPGEINHTPITTNEIFYKCVESI